MAKDKKERFAKKIDIRNRRASFEYSFLDTYVAGLVLSGTEIKSIREGRINLQDSFCLFLNNELYARQLHISPYEQGTHYNHNPVRDRKLLLNKKELKRLELELKNQGLTIIPTRLFINDWGFAKIEIALAKGKKLYDKREDIKQKDIKRDLDRD